MEMKKGLRLGYRVLIIVTVIVFVLGTYNIISFLGGFSDSSISPNLSRDESTGNWRLTFSGNPKNNGLLDESLSFEITIFDADGNPISTNSTTVIVRAGSSQAFSLTMTVPSEMVPEGNIEQARGSLEIRMGLSEFGGLMGLKQVMRVGSGTQ